MLFGHKTILDRLTTPGSQTRSPIPWSKPLKQLPPIDNDENTQSSPTKQKAAKVSFSSRVSSAGLDSAKVRKFNEIPKIFDTNRPQTIHDVRPDPNQHGLSSPLAAKREIHHKLSAPVFGKAKVCLGLDSSGNSPDIEPRIPLFSRFVSWICLFDMTFA